MRSAAASRDADAVRRGRRPGRAPSTRSARPCPSSSRRCGCRWSRERDLARGDQLREQRVALAHLRRSLRDLAEERRPFSSPMSLTTIANQSSSSASMPRLPFQRGCAGPRRSSGSSSGFTRLVLYDGEEVDAVADPVAVWRTPRRQVLEVRERRTAPAASRGRAPRAPGRWSR